MEKVKQYFRENRERHLRELAEFLHIPSVSSLSEHKEDMKKAAEWLASSLRQAGLQEVKVMPTKGHPVVYGEWLGAPGKPTVLIYGHYDVQPVDPLKLWESPPFQATIKDGKLYARGASDDKGQVFMHVKVLEALMRLNGKLPVNVKVCLEGEEEVGSPNLDDFIAEHRELLAADMVLISDTALWAKGQPAICYGLRGLCGLQVDMRGAKQDLHSGIFGGIVRNPLQAMAKLLASLTDDDGKVAVAGFYDKVRELTEQERTELAKIAKDEEEQRKELGVTELFGEKGYTAIERSLARPTLEINGMWGGFQGEGTKTVIPAEAHAKITCRLVNDQDPEEILQLLEDHLHRHTPSGVTISITRIDKGKPYTANINHPAIQAAARAYEATYGVAPLYTRMGGSIPVVETFHRLLDTPVVMMGFGLPDENFHAPNEHFHLENFDTGMLTICRFYDEIVESYKEK